MVLTYIGGISFVFYIFSQKRGELYLLMKLPEAGASVSAFSLKVKLAVFNSDHDVIITA